MSCSDCPQRPPEENVSQPVLEVTPAPKRGTGWVVYTGGTHERHLAMMRHTLPPDYDRVTIHDDGSIEYKRVPDDWEPPSPIEGYQRDPNNPLSFRPLWKSCQWRMYGTKVKETCQCIQVLPACSHPATVLSAHGLVEFDTCKHCPNRKPIPTPKLPARRPLPEPYQQQPMKPRTFMSSQQSSASCL